MSSFVDATLPAVYDSNTAGRFALYAYGSCGLYHKYDVTKKYIDYLKIGVSANNKEAISRLADTYYRHGNNIGGSEAIKYYKLAGKLGHSYALRKLGDLYEKSGKFDLALYYYSHEVVVPDGYQSCFRYIDIARVYIAIGDFDTAIRFSETFAEKMRDDDIRKYGYLKYFVANFAKSNASPDNVASVIGLIRKYCSDAYGSFAWTSQSWFIGVRTVAIQALLMLAES